MNEKISITALVTGIPPFVHGPRLRKGESQIQFLVRHHPYEWNNMIEYLGKEGGASELTCSLLRSLNATDINDPFVISEVEGWANYRLPGLARTLESLAGLREVLLYRRPNLATFDDLVSFQLLQILWPREKNPSADNSYEKMASEMGVEVISIETGSRKEIDLSQYLPYIKGKYLWVLPGGSRVDPIVKLSIQRVLSQMEADPRLRLYFDGSYSYICCVSALELSAIGRRGLPGNPGILARVLKEEGFSFFSDSGAGSGLCEIEQIYGGTYPFPRPASWIRKLFSR